MNTLYTIHLFATPAVYYSLNLKHPVYYSLYLEHPVYYSLYLEHPVYDSINLEHPVYLLFFLYGTLSAYYFILQFWITSNRFNLLVWNTLYLSILILFSKHTVHNSFDLENLQPFIFTPSIFVYYSLYFVHPVYFSTPVYLFLIVYIDSIPKLIRRHFFRSFKWWIMKYLLEQRMQK